MTAVAPVHGAEERPRVGEQPSRTQAPSVAAPLTLGQALREDLARHAWGSGVAPTVLGVLTPGFQAVALHRFAGWTRERRGVTRKLTRLLYHAGYHAVRNVYGIELPETVDLGRRVRIAHQSGIVVHPAARIGDDCVLRQNVSLGAARGDEARFYAQAPTLGRGVSCGAGAVVVGAVTIGDGAWLGPNVVVMTNVPAGAHVLPPAPRIMRLPAQVAQREERLGAP